MTNIKSTLYVDHETWLDDIGSNINVPISDNAISLPEYIGNGTLHEYLVEDGFKVSFGEMELQNQLEIISEASSSKEGYIIIFKYIERGSSFFKPIKGNYKEVKSGGAQFFSTNVSNHLIFPAASHCFIFRVSISLDWIQENMSKFLDQNKAFKNFILSKRRTMHFEPLTNRFVRLFKDVFNSEFDRKLLNLIVKDKGFEAVVLFFDHYYKQFFSNEVQVSKYSIEDQKRLYELVDFIKSNLDQELTLAMLSREVGFSKSKMQSMFHYFFHKSIYNYIKNLRFERSVELLLGTEEDIRFVAHKLGYNSSTHFINIFKKHFGVSPKKFRLKHRNEISNLNGNAVLSSNGKMTNPAPTVMN